MASMIENLTPQLSDQLKHRTAATLFDISSTNSNTTYYKESPLLSDFREKMQTCDLFTAPQDESLRNHQLLEIFTSSIPFSEYADYHPFISRLFETPCRVSRIANLLAPGIPSRIYHSSGTSGAAAKMFPRCIRQNWPTSTGSATDGEPTCMLFSARYKQIVDVVDDEGEMILHRILVCLISSTAIRGDQEFDLDEDRLSMSKNVPPNNTSPFAVTLIQEYSSYLLMHGFFALVDPKLAAITTTIGPLFHDFIRLLEGNWEKLVDAIEAGNLPDFEGLEDSRGHLQGLLAANPIRAGELRSIIVGAEGWLQQVWPKLRIVSVTLGGSFSTVIPKLRYHLGPQVALFGVGFGSTEAKVASAIVGHVDVFKGWDQEYIEYLDIERQEYVKELSQIWELQSGKRYEPVATTREGLWRYRLGDIIQVVGFDPVDGLPIMRYMGRRNMSIRISGAVLTERNLADAIHSLKDSIGDVAEFTTFVDDRDVPSACGYFVELRDRDRNLKVGAGARSLLHARLAQDNEPYRLSSASGKMGIPSIHVVTPGTFGKYREWKASVGGSGYGQIKVPSVVPNNEVAEWFKQKVAYEI